MGLATAGWTLLCQDAPVLYMVVETFIHGARPVYERAAERGRMLPPGLEYVDSWVDEPASSAASS